LDAVEPVEKEDLAQPTGCKHPLPSCRVHKEGESVAQIGQVALTSLDLNQHIKPNMYTRNYTRHS
jgi:hypothetical protein